MSEIVQPVWPFRAHAIFDAQPRYLSRAVRPFLPRYFPGHRNYIWLDADCWVQERFALINLMQIAETGALAAIPAVDRSYVHSDNSRDWVATRNRMALGNDSANRLRPFNYINAGVLAARGDTGLWQAWADRFQAALDRWEGFFLSDQAIVNALVYLDRLPVVLLSSEYNWICHLSLPLWLADKRRFANPNFPWTVIGILHNTFDDKRRTLRLPVNGGAILEMPLSFSAYRKLAFESGREKLADQSP